MPRSYAITAAKRDKMLAALRGGGLYRDAAGSAGIPWRTWVEWCKAVREDTCTDPDVVALVTEARIAYASTNVGLTASIAKAAPEDWRAALSLLQHRQGDPAERSRRVRERYEARLAKARATDAERGTSAGVVVVELPASLARPRDA